ncbi:MAG TPA: energy-coupling factor transporter transmembrane component T [Nitrososphaerales archaeon]|nr:energy-coupling factor transporter transmembrane component T [Nitrososphaerales archaeon]
MQWIASGFLFSRGQTVVHRLDPRVRLALAIALFVVSLASHSIVELIGIIALILALVSVAKILRRFSRSMVFTAAITLIAFVIYYFVSSPLNALTFALRLLAVIASTSVFFLTTTPDELEHMMRWMKIPSDFVMIFVIAVRFVPVILLDSIQIMDAQRSRGLELDKGNFIQRIRNTIPVLVPLIAASLNRSLDLAEAMDSRAYGAYPRPTSLYIMKLSLSDWLVFSLIVIGTAFGLYIALFVHLL